MTSEYTTPDEQKPQYVCGENVPSKVQNALTRTLDKNKKGLDLLAE